MCGRKAKKLIGAPADEFLQFFLDELHQHFQPADGNAPFDNEEGRYFVETWDMHDLIFDELEGTADSRTLDWIYKRLKGDITYCKRDWQIMSPGHALSSAWDQFCQAVKHETRFLFFKDEPEQSDEPYYVHPADMLSELGDVIRGCGLIRDIPSGSRIFRVRGHAAGKGFTDPVDVGPPPLDQAKTAGRMNSPGIVVMYASLDRNTALIEATCEHSELSVAEFEFLQNLRVVDLTNIPAVPSIFERGPREYLQFLHRFARDVSQPFTPDTEVHVEYTPTEVVSEYLRHRLSDKDGQHISGVMYRSAKNNGGINLALFIESEDVEGVPSKRWKPRQPLLRTIRVTEDVRPIP